MAVKLDFPSPHELNDWHEDVAFLPDITWRDVETYLIDTPSEYTKESMRAYKSLDAYDYFVCGHVQSCYYNEISTECEFCYIKSKVS